MAGTHDRQTFLAVEYIPIPPATGVAGPFVPGKDDETAILVELMRRIIQALSIRVAYLEIVTLVPDEIQPCRIPPETEELFLSPSTDCGAGLSV